MSRALNAQYAPLIKKVLLVMLVSIISVTVTHKPVNATISPEQRKLFESGILYYDAEQTAVACSGISDGGSLGFDALTLRYPLIPDEAGVIQALKQYIAEKFSDSPFADNPQYVDQIFTISKRVDRDINPLLVISIAKQENGFGQASGNATANNNYFGITSASGYPTVNGYARFPTVEESIDYFIEKISRHVNTPDGPYKDVTNFYEYLSVHQVGLIAYPGEYPDGAPGKDANPPYLTYDPRMDVYTSWDVNRNSHVPYWDPVDNPYLYNPGIYFRNSVNLINTITGLNMSTEPVRGENFGGGGLCNGGNTTPTGLAAEYIEDCGANDGNAAIACTAINQLLDIPYSQEQRADPTDPDPQFLDCSAFTGMAVYRTFGVNLQGLCSVNHLTNENFTVIDDIRTIQPGDFVGRGATCGVDEAGITGHIAIVVSYDPETQKLITAESSSEEHPSGLRGIGGEHGYNVGLEVDGNGSYTWAVRYIGDKTLQPGAL